MKKLFFLLAVAAFALVSFNSCSNGNSSSSSQIQEQSESQEGAQVEVLYFHGKQRCKTCVAIENETKAVMEGELFAAVEEGKVSFRIIDITSDEGKPIAEKYKITFSSLLIVSNPGEGEKVEDLTSFAFANARNNPESFRQELQTKVMENLN